jgi:uncharacterized protein DUF6973
MNNAIKGFCLVVLCVSITQAGPGDQWRDRRGDFRAVLAQEGHSGWCDWTRFSLLTMMSYTAAKNEGERRGWSSGQINALRHALWQYQLTHAFGDAAAQSIGDQQEQYSTDPKDSAIDQHNNQVARNLYLTNQQAGIPLGQAIRAIVESIEHKDSRFITRQMP